MAMEKTVETRADIQRTLDRFTRGEIDFQALLAALDQIFVSDPAARRVALELVERQQPNGALQRSFFRVLKERIEQQLGTPPPRPGGRAPTGSRAAPPATPAGTRPDATRPFGARTGARPDRARPDVTRPLDFSLSGEEERTPVETTAPFTPRGDRGSADATRPLRSSEPPPSGISAAEARRAFRSPATGDAVAPPDSGATPAATTPREDGAATVSSQDERPRVEAASTPPPPAREEPSATHPAEPASPAPGSGSADDRFVARRRAGGFGRGRYANRGWAASSRQDKKEPATPPPSPVHAGTAPAASVDPEPSATVPPDFDIGTPATDRAGASAESAPAGGPFDPRRTRPPDELDLAPRSTPHAPPADATGPVPGEAAIAEPASAKSAPPDEPQAAPGGPAEPVEPVRSAPPPRPPFGRRRQPLPPPRADELLPFPEGERPFVTERRVIAPPRPQPLARVGGILVILLLFALAFLGPLREYVPGMANFLQRDVPEALRKVVPAPDSSEEVSVPPAESPPTAESPPAESPPAVASGQGVPGETGAAPAGAPPSAPKRADASGKLVPGDPRTVVGGTGSPGPETTRTPPAASRTPAPPPAGASSSTKTDASGAAPAAAATQTPKPATPPDASSTASPVAPAPKTAAPGAVAAAPAKEAPAKTAAPTPFPAGRFAFASRSYSTRENGGMVAIRIQRRGGSAGPASVAWTTRAESAEPGNDYADFGVRVEQFADGEREKVIYVPIADDGIAEPRESFSVQLENPSEGATLDTVSDVAVTIMDDDN